MWEEYKNIIKKVKKKLNIFQKKGNTVITWLKFQF